MNWLRLYTDILDDEKVAQLSDNHYKIFTFLMLMACENDSSGVVTQSHQAIAWRLRMPIHRIKSAITKLEQLNIISNKNNNITFINWTKRQYKSDDVNARVKRYREKKETLQLTLENRAEQIQNRADTEGETETDEKKTAFMNNLKPLIDKTKARYPGQREQQEIIVFIQANIRNRNPDAILHCIESIIKAPGQIKSLPAYLNAALKIEDGKYNAADSERRCNAFKKMGETAVDDLIGGIGRGI